MNDPHFHIGRIEGAFKTLRDHDFITQKQYEDLKESCEIVLKSLPLPF